MVNVPDVLVIDPANDVGEFEMLVKFDVNNWVLVAVELNAEFMLVIK
jgi:hypothetical protein